MKCFDSDNKKLITITDSPNNRYDLVKLEKINKFPYFLIGNIIARYDIENIDKYINGVGILIGPNIILTVAHNLVIEINNKIYKPTKIFINLTTNCDFHLINGLKSKNSYVPNEYIEALKAKDHIIQLMNDWGLIFLQKDVGDYIIKILELENYPMLKKDKNLGLYEFFLKNKNIEKYLQNNENKISILGYTICKSKCLENFDYKFKDHFVNMKISDKNTDSLNLKMGMEGYRRSSEEISIIGTEKAQELYLGEDYVIFDNPNYVKIFNESDKDKLIMSESRGELDKKHENIKSFKYQISTYKGQSGSPIFRRSLKLTSNFLEDEFDYHFIGLHSRSDRYFLSEFSEDMGKMNQSNENYDVYRDGKNLYKLALSIHGEIISKIERVVKNNSLGSYNLFSIVHENKSDFVNLKIILNDEPKLCGLFKKNVPMWIIFNFAGNILNINLEHILLKEINQNAVIQNFNYDRNKLLQNVMVDSNCFFVNIDLLINIKLYGENLAKKIVSKFLENYDIEEKQLQGLNMANAFVKKLFGSVFSELSQFSSIKSVYGKLFKKIKRLILKNFNIDENMTDNISEISL